MDIIGHACESFAHTDGARAGADFQESRTAGTDIRFTAKSKKVRRLGPDQQTRRDYGSGAMKKTLHHLITAILNVCLLPPTSRRPMYTPLATLLPLSFLPSHST